MPSFRQNSLCLHLSPAREQRIVRRFSFFMQTNDTRNMIAMYFSMTQSIKSRMSVLAASILLTGTVSAELPSLRLQPFAEGLTSPIALTPLNDGKGSMLLADQVGTISLVSSGGIVRGQPFLSLSHRLTKLNLGFDERGVLGVVAHPKFKENGKIYVTYAAPLRETAPKDWNHTTRVSEFSIMADDNERINLDSEKVLIEYDQPYFNHNGGSLAFGPKDGYLYIASGDGGNANGTGMGHSEIGNSQDLSNLLGKILRIDVNHGSPYSIPADNPFQSEHQKKEIFATGLRNPWRISFDRGGSHALFAADIGQNLYEEVNIITKGANYGWNVREGFHGFNPKKPKESPENSPEKDVRGQSFTDPIIEYKNANAFRNDPEAYGISITGGYVYRGEKIQGLQGQYVFADWSKNWALPSGVLLAAGKNDAGDWSVQVLDAEGPTNGKLGFYITAFGEDDQGELYVLTAGSNALMNKKGKVYKLVSK